MNLIQAKRFYYHPRLHVAPPPKVVNIDEDGMIEDSAPEPFYLEMITYFDYEMVFQYIKEKFNTNIIPILKDSALRQIKYIYETDIIPRAKKEKISALDLLLFTINTTAAKYKMDDILMKKIFEIGSPEHINSGLESYWDKVTMSRIEGIDHVIRRKNVD